MKVPLGFCVTDPLNQHYLLSLRDARFYIERWRRACADDRPRVACASLTPSEFSRTCLPSPCASTVCLAAGG